MNGSGSTEPPKDLMKALRESMDAAKARRIGSGSTNKEPATAEAKSSALDAWWDEAPMPYIEGECCASGSCEVCQPHRFREWSS